MMRPVLVLLAFFMGSCAGPTSVLRGDPTDIVALKRACDRADDKKCVDLGLLYYDGRRLPQNFDWALNLFIDACKDGIPSGCNDEGMMYLDGKGVDRDVPHAMELLTLACNGGEQVACRMIATLGAAPK